MNYNVNLILKLTQMCLFNLKNCNDEIVNCNDEIVNKHRIANHIELKHRIATQEEK